MSLKRVAILGGIRIPFCRSGTAYRSVGNFEMLSHCLTRLVEKYHLRGERLGDVSMGAVMKHSGDWNLSREVVLESGLSPDTPAFDIQRACGTSVEAAILVGNKIALGQIECGIAGGCDSNSDVPIEYQPDFSKRLVSWSRAKNWSERFSLLSGFRPKELKPKVPDVVEPRTQLSMGQHCELMAQQWGISRVEQDELALKSHQTAVQAFREGFYADLVTPFSGLERDNNLREDTSLEKLGKLKPSFDFTGRGTLTAGNSSPLTDGAACVLLASEDWAQRHKIPVQSYLITGEVAAVDFVRTEGLLMAPVYAAARMLHRIKMSLQDFDYYEIHEAFAAQVLCNLAAWKSEKFCREKLGLEKALGEIDRTKLNTKGGSVALGHPFAASGGRIVATLSKMLAGKKGARGFVSVCTAGGMGVTAVLEGA